jgi:hypothetical protein
MAIQTETRRPSARSRMPLESHAEPRLSNPEYAPIALSLALICPAACD